MAGGVGGRHPVSGAFVFHVGAPGANPAGIAAQVLGGGTPASVSVVFSVVRALDFLLLLLVGGGTLLLVRASAAPRRRYGRGCRAPRRRRGPAGPRRARRDRAQGAAAGGFGLGEALHWDVVSAVLDTRFGTVWLVQAGLALAAAVLLAQRPALPLRVAALAPAALSLLTPSLSGHASVSGRIAFVADVAHVAAAAVWVGGLAALVLALVWARAERWSSPSARCRASPRFAVVAVSWLIASGTTSGYLQVRALRGLWETTYGQLLLVKLALVLPLLALGLYNNRRAVPRLRDRLASAAERTRFLRTAGVELALMVAIVGVTAVLVSEPPARAQVAPNGPYATTAPLGDLELNLVVDPAIAGRNQIHLYLTNRSGQPTDVDEASVSATLASREIGPLRLVAHHGRPRPFHRPRRAARARRRLAAPGRDSPRRVRRGDARPSPSQSERTPTDEEVPAPARARAHCCSRRPRALTSPSTRTRSLRTASPASPSASRTRGRTRTRRRSS